MKIKVKLMNRFYTAEGESVIEALEKLKVPHVKGSSVVVYEENGHTKERVLSSFITQNLFGSSGRMGKEIASKKLKQLFT